MAEATTTTDYYGTLNLPTGAGIIGIHNAYARLSGELAQLGEVDEASSEALRKLNEAYNVLSRADTRRAYDEQFLAAERAVAVAVANKRTRKRRRMQNALVGALLVIVLSQAAGLAYLGRDHVMTVVDAIQEWATPGEAG